MVSKDNALKRPGVGRPPKDLAGDVRTRILDAAQRVFLEKGYQSASLDEIAAMAPASKPTIYAHFEGKEGLFTAVVVRIIDGLAIEGYEPKGRTVQDKLTGLGTELVERFIGDMIGVTRATIAEAERFPDLSRHLHEAARDQAANAVSHVLKDATNLLSRSSKATFQSEEKCSHGTDLHGPHFAPSADASPNGRRSQTPSEGPAVVRARTRQFFPGGL